MYNKWQSVNPLVWNQESKGCSYINNCFYCGSCGHYLRAQKEKKIVNSSLPFGSGSQIVLFLNSCRVCAILSGFSLLRK